MATPKHVSDTGSADMDLEVSLKFRLQWNRTMACLVSHRSFSAMKSKIGVARAFFEKVPLISAARHSWMGSASSIHCVASVTSRQNFLNSTRSCARAHSLRRSSLFTWDAMPAAASGVVGQGAATRRPAPHPPRRMQRGCAVVRRVSERPAGAARGRQADIARGRPLLAPPWRF